MTSARWKARVFGLAAVAGALLSSSASAFACAVCYGSSLGEKGIHALKSGILILLLPTVAMFSVLMWLTFRYRNACPSWRRALSSRVLSPGVLSSDDLPATAGSSEVEPAHSGI